jgi:hypothetical protein
MKKLEIKLAHIRALLDQHHLDALLLQRVSSFTWSSCGATSCVKAASTTGRPLYLSPVRAAMRPARPGAPQGYGIESI